MKRIVIICWFSLTMMWACTEFLSQDVSEVMLAINSPRDSLITQSELITFWWELDRKVEKYRVQIVARDFDDPELKLDTLTIDNRVSISLAEGRYSWKLRAVNEESESNDELRQLFIDQTAPFEAKAIYPISGATVDLNLQDSLILKWQSQDVPIDGVSFQVSDSVYLYQGEGATATLIGSTWLDETQVSAWDITTLVQQTISGASTQFEWTVSSIDQAGNRTLSDPIPFVVRQL